MCVCVPVNAQHFLIYLMSRASNDGKQPVASPPSDHTGFLHKRGHLNTAFKRRFFVLTGAKLSYYEDVTAAHRAVVVEASP